MKLTADLIESFAGTYLSPRYDDACPTPKFHRECWALYASDTLAAMAIAPRDHAKSTALTFDYMLAELMFRVSEYAILIGSTEDNASELLGNITDELHSNEDLQADFGPFKFLTSSKTDIIVEFSDGHRFRVIAKGAEQRIRGKMWNGKRPDLIVGDDMEDDEQVESRDRRAKFRRWFFRAAKQALSLHGKIRVHGTILHEDSLLSRLRTNEEWKHLFYKAHRSYDEFEDLLWPERWSEEKLKARQREFIADQDPGGYSQEFLNDPMDLADAYLRKEDFLPMEEEDFSKPMVVGVGVDFAVSIKDKANRTSFTIGGKCTKNYLYVLDERVGRWDSLEIVNIMFEIQARWSPEIFWVEDGSIWQSMSPMVYREMQTRGKFLNIQARRSIKDKGSRGRTLQKHMRAGAVKFDKDTSWYAGFEAELLKFTGITQATLDDQFDSCALLALGFEELAMVEEDDFLEEEEIEARRHGHKVNQGRSSVTGY